jgi:hypothetical protein
MTIWLIWTVIFEFDSQVHQHKIVMLPTEQKLFQSLKVTIFRYHLHIYISFAVLPKWHQLRFSKFSIFFSKNSPLKLKNIFKNTKHYTNFHSSHSFVKTSGVWQTSLFLFFLNFCRITLYNCAPFSSVSAAFSPPPLARLSVFFASFFYFLGWLLLLFSPRQQTDKVVQFHTPSRSIKVSRFFPSPSLTVESSSPIPPPTYRVFSRRNRRPQIWSGKKKHELRKGPSDVCSASIAQCRRPFRLRCHHRRRRRIPFKIIFVQCTG